MFPQARIKRYPFDIFNKEWISIDDRLTSNNGCRLETHPIILSASKNLLIF